MYRYTQLVVFVFLLTLSVSLARSSSVTEGYKCQRGQCWTEVEPRDDFCSEIFRYEYTTMAPANLMCYCCRRYYFGTVLQFQIHKAMCLASGQYRPNDPNKLLHKCDIYRSKEAGAIVKKIMESGSSENWRDTLSLAIGENKLDGSALREFFQPLEEWLRNENLRTGQFIGWNYDGDYCKHSIETANLQVYGGFYNGANSPVTPTLMLISLLSSLLICAHGYLI